MDKINKLNANAILATYEKEFSKKTIQLEIRDKKYEVNIDTKFKISELQKVFPTALDNFKKIEDINPQVASLYFFYLLMKHFTDIEMLKTEDLEGQIKLIKAMVDLQIFDKILNEFDQKELEKANDLLVKFCEEVKANIESQKESFQETKKEESPLQ